MYYSAIVDPDSTNEVELGETDVLVAISEAYNIDLTIIKEPSDELLTFAVEQGAIRTPVVMAGKKVVGWGDDAVINLIKHHKKYPHVEYLGARHYDNTYAKRLAE